MVGNPGARNTDINEKPQKLLPTSGCTHSEAAAPSYNEGRGRNYER